MLHYNVKRTRDYPLIIFCEISFISHSFSSFSAYLLTLLFYLPQEEKFQAHKLKLIN